MSIERIREALSREPFRPFRVTLREGDPVDVLRPDWVMVGPYWIVVCQDPMPPTFFEPRAVISIEYLKKTTRRS